MSDSTTNNVDVRTENGTVITTTKEKADKIEAKKAEKNKPKNTTIRKKDNDKYRFDLIGIDFNLNTSYKKLKQAYGSYGKYAKQIAQHHMETFIEKWSVYDVEMGSNAPMIFSKGVKLADKMIPVWKECNEYGFGHSYKRNSTMQIFDPENVVDPNTGYCSSLDLIKLAYTYRTINAFKDALKSSRKLYEELTGVSVEEQIPKSQTVSEEDQAEATKEIAEAQESGDTAKEQKTVEETGNAGGGFNSNAVSSDVKTGDSSGALDNTVEEGKKTKSAKEVFNSLVTKATGFAEKIAGFLNSINDAMAKMQEGINGFISKAQDKIGGLADKLGFDLADNNILDKLSRHYGSNLGLLDNLTKDLMGAVTGMANDLLSSAQSLGFAYLAEMGGEVLDKAVLKIVQGLCYTGGDVNYNGTFLKYIMSCDFAHCLEFLDKKNNTVYSLDTTEYTRANVAAQKGCVRVPLHICKQLYKKYKTYKTETTASGKSEEEILAASDKAKSYASTIAYIFKNVFVYAYSNLNETILKEWFTSFPDIINPSILGDTDNLYNRKYALTDYDIETIAPIVELNEPSSSGWSNLVSFENVGGFGGQSLNATKAENYDNLTVQKGYIDPRNIYIKKCYLYLVGSIDESIPIDNRLVNEAFYTRMKYKTLSTMSTLKSNLYNNLMNSNSFKDIKFLLTEIAAATISDTLETLNNIGLLLPVYNMKGSNYGLSPKHKDERNVTIPKFVDYRYTKITFFNSYKTKNDTVELESYNKTIEYGTKSKLPRCEFKKEGHRLAYWAKVDIGDSLIDLSKIINASTSSSVKYKDEETVQFNSNEIRLVAVWEEGESNYDSSSDDTDVKLSNDIDVEDIFNKADELLSSVNYIQEFVKYSLLLSNFKVIDTFNKTEDQILNEANKLENYHRVSTVDLFRLNPETNMYDLNSTLHIYCNNKDVFDNEEMTQEEKTRIEMFVITANLVKEYSYKYEVSYITKFYGETFPDGMNKPNELISEFIQLFLEAIASVKDYASNMYDNDELVVLLNLLGHGKDYDKEKITIADLPFMCQIKEDSIEIPTDEYFDFKGWYTDCTCLNKFDFESSYIVSNTVLYAKWVPKEGSRFSDNYEGSDKFKKENLKINYYDKNYEMFSGKHESKYITSFDNSLSTSLDSPTKDGYVFIGWYTDKDCITNKIDEISSYVYENDLDVFARWMDNEEYYFIENNEINILGMNVDISSLSFYTAYSMEDGTTFKISPNGLVKYGRNGSVMGNVYVPDTGYSPKGITSVNDGSRTIYLTISVNNRTGILYLYASEDKVEWSKIMECSITYFNVFDVCGAESVINLMFTKRLMYNNILFNINDSEDKVLVEENEQTVMFDVNRSTLEICKNKRILGICSTVTGKFYILIDQVGVLCVENLNDFILSDFTNELIYYGIAGWKDDLYTINYNDTGTPNSSVYAMVSDNEDFDIDDPLYVNNLKNAFLDNTRYFRTFIKAGDENVPIINNRYNWTFQYDKYGIIIPDSAYIKYNENVDIHPDRFGLKSEQGFRFVRNNKYFRTKEILDVYTPRTLLITNDNYKDYLNWSRIIFDNKGNEIGLKKITEEYLKEQGVDDLVNKNFEFEWTVKYTREELILKEVKDENGNMINVKVYDSKEITPSKSFERYLKKGGTL